MFSQLHSDMNNAQGRHFDHLCLQIPGDIFLPELGSPGSLSGKPRHGKTIPSLLQFPCRGKKTPLQSVQQLAKSPPCTPGACAELSLSLRMVTFRIFPKKEISSQAPGHGASKQDLLMIASQIFTQLLFILMQHLIKWFLLKLMILFP